MGILDKALGRVRDVTNETAQLKNKSDALYKTFSFTSIGGGSGSSTVMLYVAQYLAKEMNKQVVLVDLNLLQPDLLYNLNVDVTEENSILQYFKGFKKLEECYIKDSVIEGLHLITATPKDSIELLGTLKGDSDVIGNLIARLQVFDYIIINLPYVKNFITFVEPIKHIDKGYIVIDERLSSINKIKDFIVFLHEYQNKGNVFNKVILNKRTEYDYSYKRIEDEECELVAEIPYDISIVSSMNEKKPIAKQSFGKATTRGFSEVLEDIFKK
jgi:MinD-like ATPase involved in chromosome partitioning or flagellar assembly